MSKDHTLRMTIFWKKIVWKDPYPHQYLIWYIFAGLLLFFPALIVLAVIAITDSFNVWEAWGTMFFLQVAWLFVVIDR